MVFIDCCFGHPGPGGVASELLHDKFICSKGSMARDADNLINTGTISLNNEPIDLIHKS